jgi:hypothetical protein
MLDVTNDRVIPYWQSSSLITRGGRGICREKAKAGSALSKVTTFVLSPHLGEVSTVSSY